MTNVNITKLRKNVYELLETAIKYNEPINISTKNGNAVVLSEDDYKNIMETLYISSIPGLKEEIVEGLNANDSEFVPEDEVDWN